MNSRYGICLIFLFISFSARAQKEGNVWAFGGNAGLDFNSGSPVAIKTGIADGYQYGEGCASICDKDGALLFYTDGSSIWNRNHTKMPNGALLAPVGGNTVTYSESQAAVIVPMIRNPGKYYVFSLALSNPSDKLMYSVVDMSLNGGLGDVVAGQKVLQLGIGLTEKMTAVAGDRCNIWLMVRATQSNQYRAFEITAAGINTTPVISVCGSFPLANYTAGVIKFSPNRKKMVAACMPGDRAGMELYDFDPATGIVSNTVVIDSGYKKHYYGACFSPDGTKLYASMSGPGLLDLGVFQFNLDSPAASIAATRTNVAYKPSIGDIKAGPDGRLYVSANLRAKLSVINFPNLAGAACNFVYDAISLFTGTSDSWGLPNDVIFPLKGRNDTVFYCGSGPGVPLTATGAGPYRWTVFSGPATISGSGKTVTVTSSDHAVINLYDSSICRVDTFTLIVPRAKLNAGSSRQIHGCNSFMDTLHASLTDTVIGLTYNIAWQPVVSVYDRGNTLDPVVRPTTNTLFKIVVRTPANQGGCVWEDSVWVEPVNRAVTALFNQNTAYGCRADTVSFTNTSSGAQTIKYHWDFGDGTQDTVTHPIHIFGSQGVYTVQLRVSNELCSDSFTRVVDLEHPLHVAFSVSKDTVCFYDTVSFLNTSVGSAPLYRWDFADGGQDTATSPRHTFTRPGLYRVVLTVTDFIFCTDSISHFIQVDSPGYSRFTTTDTICAGMPVVFHGEYMTEGRTSHLWTFGDSSTRDNINPAIHTYEHGGIYYPSLTIHYRACPDELAKDTLLVHPNPLVNIGSDTSLCPGQPPVSLFNLAEEPEGYNHYWNTGSRAKELRINTPGRYSLTVSDDYGCATTDSVSIRNGCYLGIPNSFTPNGDGINDYFFPRQSLSMDVVRFHMQVFSRWGQILYATESISGRGWDGALNGVMQQEGVYAYLIEVRFSNGEQQQYQGNVTLLR